MERNFFPKLEVYLRVCLETWEKNKRIEACVSSSKVCIENLLALFQFTAPAKTNGNNFNENHQNSESNDEIDPCWQMTH